jgi:phage-related protein
MTVIGEAFVDVKPRTENFGKETEKGVTSGLSSFAGKAALTFGAALATGAAAHFVAGFVKAGAESEKIQRVSEAIIKSTGGAAGVSAVQIDQLATSLSNMSGIDDELIKSAENVTLSFTGIKNAAGEGNDIFNQTNKAALDLSTVMGGDVVSAATLLGKALNDPAEGLTKLTRSGVVFTDQQKEQIKALEKAGDTLGAQKIILGEVEREFGGAAAAAADPFQRLQVATDNLKEAIGSGLIPVLAPLATRLANFINDHTTQITNGLQSAINGLGSAFRFLEPGIRNVAGAFQFLFDKIEPLITKIGEFVDKHLPKLTGALQTNTPLVEGLSTAVVALATAFGALAVAGAVSSKFQVIGDSARALETLLGILGAGAAGPILGIAAAFAAAAGAGVLLFEKVDAVRDAFESLFGKTLAPFAAGLTFLNPFVPLAVGAKFLYDHVQPVRTAIDGLVGTITNLVSTIGDLVSTSGIGDFFANIGQTLGSLDFSKIGAALAPALASIAGIAQTVAGTISGGFSTVVGAIQSGIGPAVDFLTGLWQKYGDQVTGILVGFRDIAIAVFERAAGAVTVFIAQIANLIDFITTAAQPAFEFLAATVEIALSPLGAIVSGALAIAQQAFETFTAIVGPMWTTLWSLVTDVVSNVVGPISDVLEGVLGVIQGVVDIIAGIMTLDWSRVWSGVGEIVGSAVEIVTGELQAILGFFAGVWANAADLLTLPFTSAWTLIQGVVSAGVIAVQSFLQAAIDYVSSVWSNIGTLLSAPVEIGKDLIVGLLNAIVALFTALPGQVTNALSSFGSAIAGVITGAIGSVVGAATSLISAVVSEIGKLPGQAADALASFGSSVAGAITGAVGAAVSAAAGLVSAVVSEVASLPGKIAGAVGDFASTIGGGIRSAVAGAINSVIDRFNSLSDIDTPFGTIGLPDIPRVGFALGGVVPGPAGAPINAIIHGGEVVLNAKEQARLLFAIANRDTVPTTPARSSVMVDASFVNNGTIFGVDDLQAILDAHADRVTDRLTDIVASGRR